MNSQSKIVSHWWIARVFACVLAATLVATVSINRVKAASGDLDTSFGNGGVVTTGLSPTEHEKAKALAVQKDGRIVIGITHRLIAEAGDFILMRYNTNGTLDTTFGVGGVVQTDFLGFGGVITSVKIDSKGNIVAAGFIGTSSLEQNPDTDFAVARYTANGALDSSFGSQGKVTRSNSINDFIAAIAIQKDGKIVVAGSSYGPQPSEDFAIFRLTSNGSPDPTFAGGNILFTDFYGFQDLAMAIVVQLDGRIVVGGAIWRNSMDFGLARYNANGTLDSTFGTQGKVTTNIAGNAGEFGDHCYELLLRPVPLSPFGEEQIIAVGTGYLTSNDSSGAMVCYQSDGSLNPSFGTGGIVLTNFSTRDHIYCAVRQADGKIIIAGNSDDPNFRYQFTLARYNSNGVLDISFGQGGRVFTPIGDTSEIWEIVLAPQGGIVAAGWKRPTEVGIAIAKYLP
jgi:uncharacterized delta-60 repeat protein